MKYKKGQLLVITTGDYSDYVIVMVCKVKKDFSEESVKEKQNELIGWLNPDKFTNWLNTQGYIEELDWEEYHL